MPQLWTPAKFLQQLCSSASKYSRRQHKLNSWNMSQEQNRNPHSSSWLERYRDHEMWQMDPEPAPFTDAYWNVMENDPNVPEYHRQGARMIPPVMRRQISEYNVRPFFRTRMSPPYTPEHAPLYLLDDQDIRPSQALLQNKR